MTGLLESAGFTAARDLDPQGARVIVNVLVQVPPARRYVTGGAIGGDAYIGRWLAARYLTAEHVIAVPARRDRVDPWWTLPAYKLHRITLIEMPPGTSYADRNLRIVTEGTAVFGFPAHEEADPRSQASGTWQTIRMARRAGKMSIWACVKPPYHGRTEHWPSEFTTEAAS